MMTKKVVPFPDLLQFTVCASSYLPLHVENLACLLVTAGCHLERMLVLWSHGLPGWFWCSDEMVSFNGVDCMSRLSLHVSHEPQCQVCDTEKNGTSQTPQAITDCYEGKTREI